MVALVTLRSNEEEQHSDDHKAVFFPTKYKNDQPPSMFSSTKKYNMRPTEQKNPDDIASVEALANITSTVVKSKTFKYNALDILKNIP